MRKTKIAIAKPFEGAPKINMPSIVGASSNKPILIRIPVSGKRPIEYSVEKMPKGLELFGNIISGKIENEGNYKILICAKNAEGVSKKEVTLEILEGNVLVTPLLGYTTWNAFAANVTQEDVLTIGNRLVDLGIAEYGYSYVNTDSGWQGAYGGELDAVMPNQKFSNMKEMTDKLHALGFKCGIYSTPMLTAWGCPPELASIPGCTTGEPDPRFVSTNGGIGVIRKERNNALQWEKWGFDYLKYDWWPTDTVNAEYMRKEIKSLGRDFGFCVTVKALKEYHEYWSRYCNSYRSNPDTLGYWDNLVEIYNTYFDFEHAVCKGHYFDLDMLDVGSCRLETIQNALSEDEKLTEYSMRAFLSSPIQISSTLENVSDFELSMYCNEEIIAINQDCAFNTPVCLCRVNENGKCYDIFEKALEDGTYAYAVFNLGENDEKISFTIGDEDTVRDLWAKENIPCQSNLVLEVPSHCTRIIKITSKAIIA